MDPTAAHIGTALPEDGAGHSMSAQRGAPQDVARIICVVSAMGTQCSPSGHSSFVPPGHDEYGSSGGPVSSLPPLVVIGPVDVPDVSASSSVVPPSASQDPQPVELSAPPVVDPSPPLDDDIVIAS